MVPREIVCGGLLVMAPIACVDRPLDFGDTGSSSAAGGTTTTGDTPTSGPSDPSLPGTATVTTMPGTATVTTMPGTTETTMTTVTSMGTSTASTTDDPGSSTVDPSGPDEPKLDLSSSPSGVPQGLASGCTEEPPGATQVVGESLLGTNMLTRAYFGYVAFNGTLNEVRLLFLDAGADPAVAFAELQQSFGDITTGPGVQVVPNQQFTEQNPFWFGVDEAAVLSVRVAGDGTEVLATVDISGRAGDWEFLSPGNPARLLGSIGPGGGNFQFVGEFDAVYCDFLTQEIFAE